MRAQKHEVLSRGISTGYFRCFRGKETIGFSSRFLGIPDFHRFRGKGTISRVPKNDHFFALFSENGTLTVSVKTPESDHESSSCVDQDLDEFSVVFELTPCDVGSPRKGS